MDEFSFPVIQLPPEVDTPERAVRFLVAELVRIGHLPADVTDEVIRRVWQREQLGTTVIGRGIALPHAKIQTVSGACWIVGQCARPIAWSGALDGAPVGRVCLLVAQTGATSAFLRQLERLVRQLRGED